MNNFNIGAWVPYLNSPGVLMGFVLTVIAYVLCSILKINKSNGKIAFRITNGFLGIALTIVVTSFAIELREIKKPDTSPREAKSEKSIHITQDTSKSIDNTRVNPALINASSAQQITTGISMSGIQSNNIQIVGGTGNTVINNSGHTK